MDKFYKDFRDNLNNRPEPDFVETDWLSLQSKMESKPRKPFVIPPFWWLIPFVLLSFGSNVYFFSQMRKANDLLTEFIIQEDTIYQKKVIYQTDTIYIEMESNKVSRADRLGTEVIRRGLNQNNIEITINGIEMKPERVAKSDRFGVETIDERLNQHDMEITINGVEMKLERVAKSDRFDAETIDERSQNNTGIAGNSLETQSDSISKTEKLGAEVIDGKLSQNNTGVAGNTVENTLEKESKTVNVETNFLDVPTLTLKSNALLSLNLPTPIKKSSKEKISENLTTIKNFVRPNSYELGVIGGLSYPLASNIHDQTGSNWGAEVKLKFSNAIEFFGTGSYSNLYFESYKMNASLGIPTIQPPTTDFKLAKVDVDYPSLQYSLGLTYYFNAHREFRPFVGLGYEKVFLLPSKFDYTFINDFDLKWESNETVRNETIRGDYALIRLGMEYQLAEKWQIQIRGFYYYNFNQNLFLLPTSAGIQAGVFYKF